MNIGFVGLGVMGNPMALNLIRSGDYRVRVYDIDTARAQNLVDQGAELSASIADVVADADVVMTSLPGPKQIEAVGLAENGIVNHLRSGAVWIDLSTNNLDCAAAIRQATAARDIDILDAPVSGGDEGARAGKLTVLVGGRHAVFKRYQTLLEVIGEQIIWLGAHGAGYSAKIAQVVLCYLHSLALSESLMLGIKGGVDPEKMLSIIQNSTGQSYVANRYGPPVLVGDYDPSFTVGLAHKDLWLAREMADNLGIRLPMCELTTETYARAVAEFGFDANHLKAVRLLEQDNNTFLQIQSGDKV